MKSLESLERAFQDHIYRPGRAMQRRVLPGPRASAERRLAVYANAYRSRMVEALGKDYEALRVFLGERDFERLMLDFIAAYPSRHPNLRWYGAQLARFVSRPGRGRKRPVLSELAQLEWALGLAFDAADTPALGPAQIAQTPASGWPQLRFRLHPSVRRLDLRGNAPDLWRAATDGRRLPRVRTGRSAKPWLVWRKGLVPFYRALAPDEAWALGALERGREFAAVCSGLRRFVGEAHAARRGAQLLGNWASEGLLLDPREPSVTRSVAEVTARD